MIQKVKMRMCITINIGHNDTHYEIIRVDNVENVENFLLFKRCSIQEAGERYTKQIKQGYPTIVSL